jgi:gluconolactonase
MPYFEDKKRGDTMQKECNPLRRSFLKAAAGSGLAALGGVAIAQSIDFKPSTRYPDPAVQILDPSAAKTCALVDRRTTACT